MVFLCSLIRLTGVCADRDQPEFLCSRSDSRVPRSPCGHSGRLKGLITVGRELRQQHPSDLLSGAGTSRERSSRDVPAPDNKSLGCCCRNSLPTVINPDYNMTKQRYITRIYDKKTFKITTKSSDVAYLPPL